MHIQEHPSSEELGRRRSRGDHRSGHHPGRTSERYGLGKLYS